MKKIITIIIFSFIAFTSLLHSAEAEHDEDNIEKVTIEESIEDLSNRLILSVFGKEALFWFEAREITNLNDVNSSDLNLAPFKNLNKEVKLMFIAITYIVITMYIIFLVWISYNAIIKTQESGDFLGRSWSKPFFTIKIFISLFLITPVISNNDNSYENINTILKDNSVIEIKKDYSSNINYAQALTFYIAGQSNSLGRSLNKSLNDFQPRMYPSMRIPNNDVKFYDMERIIDFQFCMRFNSYDSKDITINFNKNKNKIIGSYKYKKCSLEVSFNIDEQTTKIIKDDEYLSSMFPDFDNTQIEIFKNSLANIFDKASIVSENLVTKKPFEDRENIFKNYTKEKKTNNYSFLDDYENYCNDVFSDTFFDKNNGLTEKERHIYKYMATRCLSSYFNKSIIYSKNFSNKYLSENNYLRNNTVELCTHDYSENVEAKAKYNIENENTEITTKLSNFNSESNYKYLSPKSCIEKECSDLNSDNPNLYLCSNAINLYNKIKTSKEISNYGFISLGANIYNHFTSFHADNTKIPYNTFNVSDESDKTTNSETNKAFSIKILNKGSTLEHHGSNIKKDYDLYSSSSVNSLYFEINENESDLSKISNAINYLFDSDFMGSKRLKTCISHPMIIVDGYSCGSVVEEYHVFGDNLFNNAMSLKAILLVIDSSIIRTNINKKKKDKNNSVSSSNKEGNKVVHYAKKIVPVIASIAVASQIEDIAATLLETDEFGNITSKKYESILSPNSAFALLIGGLSVTGSYEMIDKISTLLNTAIITSIMFKYLIPLLPYYFFLTLIFSFFILLFQMIIITPVWAIFLLKPSQNHTSDIMKRGINMFLSLYLKIPFLIVGTILAWIMTNTVASRVMSLLDFDTIMNIQYGQSLTGILDLIVSVVVYVIILFIITNITLNTMLNFYEFSTNWITGKIDKVKQGGDNTTSSIGQTQQKLTNFLKK